MEQHSFAPSNRTLSLFNKRFLWFRLAFKKGVVQRLEFLKGTGVILEPLAETDQHPTFNLTKLLSQPAKELEPLGPCVAMPGVIPLNECDDLVVRAVRCVGRRTLQNDLHEVKRT